MFKARNISVAYDKKTALDRDDYTATPGRLNAIIGPNGSGKSTLLKVLTGEFPTDGSVTLNGADIHAVPAHLLAPQRAVLAQSTTLSFPFRVRQVVEIGLYTGHHGDSHALIERALARVGMADAIGSYYQELSGGQQQRVQLARVFGAGLDACRTWRAALAAVG